MMGGIIQLIAGVFIAAGAFFFLVGAIGIYRMPDVFTRMHAAGISDTAGAGLLVVGMMLLTADMYVSAGTLELLPASIIVAKLGIIFGIIFFTSPIATHALAQAALHEGLEPAGVGDEVLIGPRAASGPEKIGRAVKSKPVASGRRTAQKAGKASATKGKTAAKPKASAKKTPASKTATKRKPAAKISQAKRKSSARAKSAKRKPTSKTAKTARSRSRKATSSKRRTRS